MKQSGILRYCYERVFEILKEEGKISGLYTITENITDEHVRNKKTMVSVGLSDLAQISQDKNGEKVFIEEQQFPAPTYIAFILTIEIAARQYQDLLETAGYIIRYFKDNNSFELDRYNWHGNKSNIIYLEPIIREPEMNQMKNIRSIPSVILEYRLEAAINSEKSESFKRVQSRDIKAMNK